MLHNIPLEDAYHILLSHVPQMDKECIKLSESLGRVIHEDIRASENIPPFARSPYDGYAFIAADTIGAVSDKPVVLEIIEEIAAGQAPQNPVTSGKAVKILTGAPIPDGADAVIKYEETRLDGNQVSIFQAFKSGENIVPAGEDVKQHDLIAAKGTVITPPIMGLMAALGIAEVPVYKRPKIGIISTGNELLDVTEPLSPGKIRNSNCYTLMGYIGELGAEPYVLGTARDEAREVAAYIQKGLQEVDIVITTGGVSVGDYDVVKEAVRLVGAETLYWKIEIKPGSPTLAAVKDGKLIFGLSGSPAAAMVIFQLLGIPLIKKAAGIHEYDHQTIEVILQKDFKKSSPRRRFLRGKLILKGGQVYMETTGDQGNGILRSMIGCNVLAEIPEGSGPIKAGEKLTAFLINR